MAYLGKTRKEDLKLLAEELNLNVEDNMKIADLSKLIATHPDYDEEFSKNVLTIIEEDRKLREQQEMVQKQQELVQEQQEFEREKERLDHEFLLEKLRLENERLKGLTSTPEAKVSIYELTKVVPKFEMKGGDIVLFLTLFERQAKRVSIEKRRLVSALLALMPAEIFRQKFVKHQWNPAQSWRDYVFEVISYFEEWLGGLGVNDFEGLKNLLITDQLKQRVVPGDAREQFADIWVKSIVPGDLAGKLDEYESVRANVRGAHSNDTRYRPTNNKFVSDNKGASLQPKDTPFFWKAKLPIESNTGTNRSFEPKCFICENVGHLARECPKNTRKTPPRNVRSNIITAKGTELEFTKEVVTARVSIPVSVPINTKNGIDDLRLVDIKCEQTSIKAVIDTGAQISVLCEDLISKGCGESEGTI
ncbi:CCHC-type domain-containing protein [Trichonephila inaurata madagascariensis]|uniref:CCHC-type domain-containing protein n=1 Tax=Trichonephila inaurata madagascariensis TaxID=2747483 RepID=A0A8X6WLH4_9ARAC|nr:CCHC-type domain-containing protein [Trichonephila inaurata madagascariensis]